MASFQMAWSLGDGLYLLKRVADGLVENSADGLVENSADGLVNNSSDGFVNNSADGLVNNSADGLVADGLVADGPDHNGIAVEWALHMVLFQLGSWHEMAVIGSRSLDVEKRRELVEVLKGMSYPHNSGD